MKSTTGKKLLYFSEKFFPITGFTSGKILVNNDGRDEKTVPIGGIRLIADINILTADISSNVTPDFLL